MYLYIYADSFAKQFRSATAPSWKEEGRPWPAFPFRTQNMGHSLLVKPEIGALPADGERSEKVVILLIDMASVV